MRYFLVVGEASADLHASTLMAQLKAQDSLAEFMFIGGDLMAQVAIKSPLVHYRELAFMGFIPVIRNLRKIKKTASLMQEAMLSFAPDVVIAVDYAGFNMRYVLPFVRRVLDKPLVYFIPPKLWAWKRWRIHRLKRYTDLLLCILPFEKDFFASYGIPSQYVGNPCVDATRSARTQQTQVSQPPKAQIALLAGSRRQELKDNLPSMLAATRCFGGRYTIVLAGAPGLSPADYAPLLKDYPEVRLVFGKTYRLVAESLVAVVTSGTASLETALLGTPQVVCYRLGGSRLIRWVWQHCFNVPFISLANLILGKEAIVELLGSEVSAQRIAHELGKLLPDQAERTEQLIAIEALRHSLGDISTAQEAATCILNWLRARHTISRGNAPTEPNRTTPQ